MTAKIEGLAWQPRWISHMGCLRGCLEALGIEMSDGWLYGGTGHAFVLNIHPELCPSGPTAWKASPLFELGHRMGYTHGGEFGFKGEAGFEDKQRRVWEHVRSAIDAGLPCYGWELAEPEYYVIVGYEGDDYCFAGPGAEDGSGRKRWDQLGISDIGCLEAYSLRPQPVESDAVVVKSALEFALAFANNRGDWIFPQNTGGLAAYDAWIAAIRADMKDAFGLSYNAACWAECRRAAGAFLREAAKRLPGVCDVSFAAAAEAYETVGAELTQISEWYPFPGQTPGLAQDMALRERACRSLGAAKSAETRGLGFLEEIVAVL